MNIHDMTDMLKIATLDRGQSLYKCTRKIVLSYIVLLHLKLRPVKLCNREKITLLDIAPINSLLGAIDGYW